MLKYQFNEKMTSSENRIIAMLEMVIKKQNETLKLMCEISKKPVPITTQDERQQYINYIRKRLCI